MPGLFRTWAIMVGHNITSFLEVVFLVPRSRWFLPSIDLGSLRRFLASYHCDWCFHMPCECQAFYSHYMTQTFQLLLVDFDTYQISSSPSSRKFHTIVIVSQCLRKSIILRLGRINNRVFRKHFNRLVSYSGWRNFIKKIQLIFNPACGLLRVNSNPDKTTTPNKYRTR